jgi:hypothetical protein
MATRDQKDDTTTRDLNSQALALAEQLGRIAGTLEGTAEAWLNKAAVTDQLTKVRDGATQLLNTLAGAAATGRRVVQGKSAAAPRRAAPSIPIPPSRRQRRRPRRANAESPTRSHKRGARGKGLPLTPYPFLRSASLDRWYYGYPQFSQ